MLGTVKALCILAVLLNAVVMLDPGQKMLTRDLKSNSILYKPVYNTGNRLMTSLKLFVDENRDDWEKALKK